MSREAEFAEDSKGGLCRAQKQALPGAELLLGQLCCEFSKPLSLAPNEEEEMRW